MHGVFETNPIEYIDGQHPCETLQGEVDLADKRLARITRLRLLGERGFPYYDLSYCYGVLKDGTPVRVRLPEHQWPRRGFERALVEMCKREGVYGKGIGILDTSVHSILI